MEKIFRYTDFRQFIAEYYSFMKSTNPSFSYRWFANKAGISSAGLYQRVQKGERNLTETTTEQFIVGMNLTGTEADYFRALVGFNQAETGSEKQRWYTVMLSMADFVEHHQLETDEYSYLSRWFHPVIRELAVMIDFHEDYSIIANAVIPKITERQAKTGIELLCRLGFLELAENGRYVQRDRAITSGKSSDSILSLARRSFNRQMITMAAESLDRFPLEKRYASGMTVGISDSCYEVILQEISAFRERIASIVDRDRGSSKVVQFNVQLFPVSTETDRENES